MRSTPFLTSARRVLRLALASHEQLQAAEVKSRWGIDELLEHFAAEEWSSSVFYDDPNGNRVLGFGRAAEFRLDVARKDRFEHCARELDRLTESLQVRPELRPLLKWFGGGSFSPSAPAPDSVWADFGSASWFLPEVLVTERQGKPCALVVAPVSQHATLEARLNDLSPRLTNRAANLPEVVARTESADPTQWQRLVLRALAQLEAGHLEKVVTARRLTVQLSSAPETSQVLRKLREQAIGCTIFALRHGESTFLGASPELLIDKQGLQIHTDALAGTLSLSEPHAAERLMASEKDRREHDFVVREITRVLAPLCQDIKVPATPELLALRRMLHLRTPIRGLLTTSCSVLDLVGRLHPTPAVGGLPTQEALRFLESEEGLDRGWYASPLGWVDADGNGRFLVALRSALLASSQCHLYAGAGIVRSSEPQLEFQETELKMEAMLGALGLGS